MHRLDQIHRLLDEQRRDWPLLGSNYAAITQVQTRSFAFDGFTIQAQFNPARIQSTGAKVDAKTIAARKCFLCRENLPAEQRSVPFGDDYTFLCNPFPIFRDHFTIPHNDHQPQSIADSFPRMVDLTRDIGSEYVVFYNGPKCGASAPDHLHFQAGEKGFLPLETEFEQLRSRYGRTIVDSSDLQLTVVDDGLRGIIAIESKDSGRLIETFARFQRAFEQHQPLEDEPMMNILGTREGETLRILILPRLKHRPKFYFAEGEGKLLLSPASVDLGGVCVLPIEADFDKLSKAHLQEMCDEVCLKGESLLALASQSS